MAGSNRTERKGELVAGLDACESISGGVLGSILATFIVSASIKGWATALNAVSNAYVVPVVIIAGVFGITKASSAKISERDARRRAKLAESLLQGQESVLHYVRQIANQEIGVTLDKLTMLELAENAASVLDEAGLATKDQLERLSQDAKAAHRNDSIFHNTADFLLREILDVVRRLDERHLSAPGSDFTTAEDPGVPFPPILLRRYRELKITSFDAEAWPYAIDEDLFVDSFDFKSGSVRHWQVHPQKESCVSVLVETLGNRPAVIVANYGMGKTTIARFLFRTWEKYSSLIEQAPVFISATDTLLSDYRADSVAARLYDEIMTTLRAAQDGSDAIAGERNRTKDTASLAHMLETRRICLILDGVDETRYRRDDFWGLRQFISQHNNSMLLTCREECQPFIDAFSYSKRDDYVAINLLGWGPTQWQSYTSALKTKNPQKSVDIANFETQLLENRFGELPTRPLFLKMLSDLIIFKVKEIEIQDKLYGNMAEVYFKYLLWRIRDDGRRKGGIREFGPESRFCTETFRLFRLMALDLYRRFGQAGPFREDSDTAATLTRGDVTERGISLAQIRRILVEPPSDDCSREEEDAFIILQPDRVAEHLANSTMFATLRRVGDVHFTFSHRSFMEYLVAYDLARGLVGSDGREASCTSTWNLFQTVEISKHFMEEIERLRVTNGLTKEQRDRQIAPAFSNVLSRLDSNPETYFEDVEEVLYYIGKFPVESEALVEHLLRIIKHPERYHRVYIRTAYLALAQCKDEDYIVEYVLRLIKSYGTGDSDFAVNRKIQCAYYGEGQLKDKLRPAVERYLQDGGIDQLVPLRIFTYFTTIPPRDVADADNLRALLQEVSEAARRHRQNAMAEVCSGIGKILKDLSRC